MGLRAVRRQLVKRYAGRNSGHAPRSALEGCRVIRPERIVIQSSVTIGGTIINKGEKLTVAGVVDEARVYGLYQGGRPQIFARAEDALRPSPLPGSRTPQIAASLFP